MNHTASEVLPERRRWIAQLARAPRATLESALEAVCEGSPLPEFEWLRAPETGLAMVRGRIGGTGDPFNVGETTVTRAVLRLNSGDCAGVIGVAYQLGRDRRRAELAALADAMLQSQRWRGRIVERLLEPLCSFFDEEKRKQNEKTASTRVDFYTMMHTMVRGD